MAETAPFVIWTYRRTGGTAFMTLLTAASKIGSWEHEPLNPERKLGHITKTWRADHDIANLRDSLDRVVAERRNIKHCIEMVESRITAELFKSCQDAGSVHIILLRRNDFDRMISLMVANQTDAWGPETAKDIFAAVASGEKIIEPIQLPTVTQQINRDAIELGKLMRLCMLRGTLPVYVFFEDLYGGSFEENRAFLAALMERVGVDIGLIPEAALERWLRDGNQNTKSVYQFVPNLEEVRVHMENLTD